jgi:hypothetical protein
VSDGETGVPNDGVRDNSVVVVVGRLADWSKKPCRSSSRWTVSRRWEGNQQQKQEYSEYCD